MTTIFNMTTTAAAGSNGFDEMRRTFFNGVAEQGRFAAKGGDAWHMTLIATVKAAANELLQPEDAEEVVSRFMKARAEKTIHDVKGAAKDISAATLKTKKSEFKSLILCGIHAADPVGTMSRAIDIYKRLHGEGTEMRNTYQAYLRVAQAAYKGKDAPLTDDEIEAAMVSPEAKEKTVEGALKAALKALEQAVQRNEASEEPMDMERVHSAARLVSAQLEYCEALTKSREAKAAYEAAAAAAAHAARMAAAA